jgi:hypothetical protein
VIKKTLLVTLLFLVSYAIFLVVTIPASILWQQVENEVPLKRYGVQVEGAEGTIWDGRLKIAYHGLGSVIAWHFKAPSIHDLSLPVKFDVSGDAGVAHFMARLGLKKQSVTITHAEVQTEALNRFFTRQGIKLAGKVLVNDLTLTVSGRKIRYVVGKISWSGGDIAYPAGVELHNRSLPPFYAEFSRKDKLTKLSVRDKDASFDVIDGELTQDGVATVQVKRRLLDLSDEYWPANSNEQDVIFKVRRKLM